MTELTDARPMGVRDILRIRDYRSLFLGQAVSDIGDGITILLMIQLLPQNTDLGQRYPTLVHQAFVDEAPTLVRPPATQP